MTITNCNIDDLPESLKEFFAQNKPLPCSSFEIDKLEKELKLTLPKTYKVFLSQMGKGVGTFWQGSQGFYKDLRNVQIWSKELLEENHFPIPLPEKAFVFLCTRATSSVFSI